MTTHISLIMAAWVIVIALGGPIFHQTFKAHYFLDYGLHYAAREHMLRTVGLDLLLLAFIGVMIGIRYLVQPLIVPIIVGSSISVLSFWLIIRASLRMRIE